MSHNWLEIAVPSRVALPSNSFGPRVPHHFNAWCSNCGALRSPDGKSILILDGARGCLP